MALLTLKQFSEKLQYPDGGGVARATVFYLARRLDLKTITRRSPSKRGRSTCAYLDDRAQKLIREEFQRIHRAKFKAAKA